MEDTTSTEATKDKPLPVTSDSKKDVSSGSESTEEMDKGQIHLIAQASHRQITYMGPLPPPQVLAGYNDVVPGAADRIIVMAEKQMTHRHEMENKVISSDIIRSYAGLGAGLIVTLACVILGAIAILYGHDAAGTTLATGSVVALAGVFVYGTAMKKKERQEKARVAAPSESKEQSQTAGPSI